MLEERPLQPLRHYETPMTNGDHQTIRFKDRRPMLKLPQQRFHLAAVDIFRDRLFLVHDLDEAVLVFTEHALPVL